MQEGIFIVIEGTDSSGKSTQFQLMKDRLEKAGHDVVAIQFPRYGEPSSYFLREYLQGNYGTVDEVGPYTASLFYALDRYQAAFDIRQWLSQGKVVLCDRFTASNMAHQGAKIDNPDVRRGYFIWLDNLEFTMLQIPRPTLTLVLYTPLGYVQDRLENKQRSSIAAKKDIHEENTEHIRKSLDVYLDLCRLFPKDFLRVDCARDGRLLSIDDVHKLLWGKVEPLLPEVKAAAAGPQPEPRLPSISSTPGVVKLQASLWAAASLPGTQASALSPVTGGYFIPSQLPADVREEYVAVMDYFIGTHLTLKTKLKAFAAKAGYSIDATGAAAELVLPLAAYQELHIPTDTAALGAYVASALDSDVLELQAIGTVLESMQPRSQQPAIPAQTNSQLRQFAQQNLPRQHTTASDTTTLASYTPRNELGVLPAILYEYSDESLAEIEARVAAWSYDRKAGLYRAYISSAGRQAKALNALSYTFDVVSDFAALQAMLQVHTDTQIEWQHPSPRLGYETPEIIEKAGLAETFEDCFDRSLMLYSHLQQVENALVAPYATLFGHRLRWKVTLTARQLADIYRAGDVRLQTLAAMLYERVAEVHPLLATEMKLVHQTGDPQPARPAAEPPARSLVDQLEQKTP